MFYVHFLYLLVSLRIQSTCAVSLVSLCIRSTCAALFNRQTVLSAFSLFGIFLFFYILVCLLQPLAPFFLFVYFPSCLFIVSSSTVYCLYLDIFSSFRSTSTLWCSSFRSFDLTLGLNVDHFATLNCHVYLLHSSITFLFHSLITFLFHYFFLLITSLGITFFHWLRFYYILSFMNFVSITFYLSWILFLLHSIFLWLCFYFIVSL